MSALGAAPEGFATIAGTPVQAQTPTINFTSVTYTLSGPVRDGETWRIIAGGTPFNYVAGTGSDALDPATVADKLDDAVDAVPGGPYNATHTNTTVTVVRADGAPFTADFQLIASGTANEAARNSIRLDLAGTPHLNEEWIVTLAGNTRSVVVSGRPRRRRSVGAVAKRLAAQVDNLAVHCERGRSRHRHHRADSRRDTEPDASM